MVDVGPNTARSDTENEDDEASRSPPAESLIFTDYGSSCATSPTPWSPVSSRTSLSSASRSPNRSGSEVESGNESAPTSPRGSSDEKGGSSNGGGSPQGSPVPAKEETAAANLDDMSSASNSPNRSGSEVESGNESAPTSPRGSSDEEGGSSNGGGSPQGSPVPAKETAAANLDDIPVPSATLPQSVKSSGCSPVITRVSSLGTADFPPTAPPDPLQPDHPHPKGFSRSGRAIKPPARYCDTGSGIQK